MENYSVETLANKTEEELVNIILDIQTQLESAQRSGKLWQENWGVANNSANELKDLLNKLLPHVIIDVKTLKF